MNRRDLLFRVAAPAGSAILILILAELALRLVAYPVAQTSGWKATTRRQFGNFLQSCTMSFEN